MNINPNYVRVPEMASANPDELFVCPYDPIHRVAAKRFPYHLMKCRKNWVGRSMSTCPFNARHIVPQPEFRHHVANCPDKCMIELEIAFMQRNENQDGAYMKGCTDIPAYNRKIPSPTEDWDREISASEIRVGYHPDEEREDVYRNLTGYTPAEKRDYYKRIGKVHFKKQEDVDTHVPGKRPPDAEQPSQPTAQDGAEPDEDSGLLAANQHQHMRLPKQLPKAAEVAAAAAAASMPNGRDASKKGGRTMAANIFGPNEDQTSDSIGITSNYISFPLTKNGYGRGTSAFSRPPPGMGRGLIPGLGRGALPGIGRGLLSLNNSIGLQSMEPRVGMKQAVTSSS